MGRDASNEAKQQLGTANNYAGTFGTTASTALKPLQSYEKNQLTNPTGYSPAELADMLTKSSQSLGGSQASAVGAGALAASRNRNSAGYTTALDDSARNAMKQQSENALGISGQDAALKQQKQQQAASSLNNIYDSSMQGTLNALGVGNGSINAQTNADQATTGLWQPVLTAAMGGASNFFKPK